MEASLAVCVLQNPTQYGLVHGEEILYAVDSQGPTKAKQGMQAHHSQLVWYRHLFLLFSRYVYINVFTKIV